MGKTIALFAAAAALAGCASLNRIDADVSSFSRWPAGRGPSTYVFERLPSQQAEPQQAQMLEDAARRAIEGAGFVAAPPGSAGDVTVQLGARITETDRSPFDDPFWYGGFGAWHRPFARGGFGRPFGGPGWRRGYWGPGYDFPYYTREVALLIRDKRAGEPLYEARAETEGATTGLYSVLPAMFVAALKDFPNGAPTNPHRVTVDPQPQPQP
jgi:hypothetical protein